MGRHSIVTLQKRSTAEEAIAAPTVDEYPQLALQVIAAERENRDAVEGFDANPTE